MDYEKGAPKNLVQFSEYNDLAFTDTGVAINDNSRPSRNVLWSSDKIERRLAEIAGNGHMGGPGHGSLLNGGNEVYNRIYRRKIYRLLRPSWWLSFVIPSRQHYCDKCCNYLEHTWSTVWNDDPKLAHTKCNSGKCAGSHPQQPPQSMLPKSK